MRVCKKGIIGQLAMYIALHAAAIASQSAEQQRRVIQDKQTSKSLLLTGDFLGAELLTRIRSTYKTDCSYRSLTLYTRTMHACWIKARV